MRDGKEWEGVIHRMRGREKEMDIQIEIISHLNPWPYLRKFMMIDMTTYGITKTIYDNNYDNNQDNISDTNTVLLLLL